MKQLPRRELNRLARKQQLLDAALVVFAREGYSGASMDAVAAEAGTSKPTLYKHYPSKEALFTAMMRARRDDMLLSIEPGDPDAMVAQLHGFAWRYARTVMRPDLLALARLIIGEAQRFPHIGVAYQQSGPDQVLDGVMTYLSHLRDEGRLQFEDAELAAQDLWGLVLSAPRTRALYDPQWVPSQAELARYIHNGLRVFLAGYAVLPERDLEELEAVIAAGTP